MGINDEHMRAQWRAELARIAEQLNDLKVRLETESRALHASLTAEIAALQSELKTLEAEVDAAAPDLYARQIAAQIEDLRVKGDTAYNLLQVSLVTQLDPADAEIRRLEAVAATASEDARSTIMARLNEMRSARDAAHAAEHPDDWTGDNGVAAH